jgi:hypothetical protein
MIQSMGVFIGLTCVLFGGCAWLAGQAVGGTWRPWWQMVVYGLMLGLADRFLGFALFQGQLLSLSGYLLDSAVLVGIGLLAHRVTLARMMVRQYPWAYVANGPLAWKEIGRH